MVVLPAPFWPRSPKISPATHDQVEVVDRGQRPVALGQAPRPDDDVLVGGGMPDRRLGASHRRPNRRNVHHRPMSTIAISATPTAPHRSDVSTVTRMSDVALAAVEVDRIVTT